LITNDPLALVKRWPDSDATPERLGVSSDTVGKARYNLLRLITHVFAKR
jgi:hypothetical protein